VFVTKLAIQSLQSVQACKKAYARTSGACQTTPTGYRSDPVVRNGCLFHRFYPLFIIIPFAYRESQKSIINNTSKTIMKKKPQKNKWPCTNYVFFSPTTCSPGHLSVYLRRYSIDQ
jgi:hypothetical protein